MPDCLYCASSRVTVGPCEPDGEACNHRLTCRACGKESTLSWNLALGHEAHDAAYEADALPLFQEIPV